MASAQADERVCANATVTGPEEVTLQPVCATATVEGPADDGGGGGGGGCTPGDCPDGEVCVDGECIPEDGGGCVEGECPDGEVCQDGECVVDDGSGDNGNGGDGGNGNGGGDEPNWLLLIAIIIGIARILTD